MADQPPPVLVLALNAVLLAAFAVDVGIAMVTWVSPGLFFQVLHGTEVYDVMDRTLLRRAGAQWAAFAGLQALALVTWRWLPWTLLLVAGARLSDLFTDWTYLVTGPPVTPWAWPILLVPGLLNLGMAGLFLYGWHAVRS